MDSNHRYALVFLSVARETTVVLPASPQPPVPEGPIIEGDSMAWLQLLTGSNAGQHLTLNQNLLTLGRDPTCTIVINSPNVSRVHAHLMGNNNRFFINDGDGAGKRSLNGTFVNGQQVTRMIELHNDDQIMICDFVCSFLEPVALQAVHQQGLADKRQKAESWVKGYTAGAVAAVLATALIPGAATAVLVALEGTMCYHIGGIYRHNWTEGDAAVAASTIGLASLAGKIAALEGAILLGPLAFAAKPVIAGGIVWGMGQLVIKYFEDLV